MASKKTFEDLDLSSEEIKKISEALKDDKFRKMFVEYAEEISNPENRKKYEEEIAMLENEKGMDVQFVHPQPGHVLKTTVNGSKSFINICTNDKIGKPSSQKREQDGKSGLYWSIPHSFSPPREDYDKENKKCMVYDVVFHPDTYRMTTNPRFMKMVEDTAFDGMERQFDCKVDRNNVRRPKLNYKGNPVATVIRSRKTDEDDTTKTKNPDANDVLSGMPYPYSDKTSAEMAEENARKTENKAKERKSKEAKTKSNIEKKEEDGYTVPKYFITHRDSLDFQDFTNAPDSKPTTRPKELAVSIELPLCKSAAGIDLDIFEERLILKLEKPAYKLDIKLPFAVDDDQGSAKFDKSKKCLVVTLPVVAAEVPKLPSFIDEAVTDINAAPLIEELKISENETATSENDQTPEPCNDVPVMPEIPIAKKVSSISYSLPQFDISQDMETVTVIFNVHNVDEDSVSRSFPSQHACEVRFLSVGSGGFPMHYSLLAKFGDDETLVPDHSTVEVCEKNMTVTLLKGRESRRLWKKYDAGLKEDDIKEKAFVTSNNNSQKLGEMGVDDKRTGEQTGEQTVQTRDPFKVNKLNQKNLTIKIGQKTPSVGIAEEEEYSDDDGPSSADIEVIHSLSTPTNLHGILKQRSMSESSEDHSSMSSDSPCTISPRDGSDGARRSVSFNSHVDHTTYKTNASVSSMKTALKSKRRRTRKKEEKKERTRRRHNSTGSECSSGEEHDTLRHAGKEMSSADESQLTVEAGQTAEDNGTLEKVTEADEKQAEFTAEDGDSKSAGILEENVIEANKQSEVKKPSEPEGEKKVKMTKVSNKLVAEVKCKLAEKKAGAEDTDSDDDEISDRTSQSVKQDQKDVDRTSMGKSEVKVKSGKQENDLSEASSESGAVEDGSKNSGDSENNKKHKVKQSGDLGAIKDDGGVKDESKLEEGMHEKGEGGDEGKNDVETELSWNEGKSKEHRTECAFQFSNDVMFDLDVD